MFNFEFLVENKNWLGREMKTKNNLEYNLAVAGQAPEGLKRRKCVDNKLEYNILPPECYTDIWRDN